MNTLAQNEGGGGDSTIRVEELTKTFGSFTAVDRISFDVKGGELFGLLGPNGAGKSTLIRMLTTLLPPTGGRALVAGHDVAKEANAVRMAIGVIPQAMTSDPDLTCEENLSIHAKLYGVPKAGRAEHIKELLAAVNLSDWRDTPAKNLSGGMRRRLEIARGLVHNPRIFFLDEPTTGLDPVSRMSVWEMIAELREKRRLTILLTTHYMDEADRLCDRIAIVDHGKLVVLDTPAALKAAVPGVGVIEALFNPDPADWEGQLKALSGTERVLRIGTGLYRIFSDNGPRTAQDLVELARTRQIELKSFSVQTTTLDDVFTHFTGTSLRDAAQNAKFDVSVFYR
jgi:ABC-2 type transport system ATP-binding protein